MPAPIGVNVREAEEIDWAPPVEKPTLTEVVYQVAIRIIFIGLSILSAAYVFPVDFHAAIVPLVAVGSTFLAGFFFPQLSPIPKPIPLDPPPLVRPIEVEPIPIDQPRGNRNHGNNCAFNSCIHFFESIPQLADWFRHPITDATELEPFLNFLADYNPPADLVVDFRDYVRQIPHPHPPVATLFQNFIENYQHPNQFFVASIQETMRRVSILHGAFSKYLEAIDRAVANNQPVVDVSSRILRLALNQVVNPNNLPDYNPIPRGPYQVDAPEIMTAVLDLLPPALKLSLETTYHMSDGGQLRPAPERAGFLTVEIQASEEAPDLNRMMQNYFDHGDIEPYQGRPVDRCTVRFLEPPPFLCMQIKRFYNEKNPTSWLSYLSLGLWPSLGWKLNKRTAPVAIPDEITVPVNGVNRQYRLASFVKHIGETVGGGHYTAGKIVHDRRYYMDDSQVTLADRESWQASLQQAYLVCYLPVQQA